MGQVVNLRTARKRAARDKATEQAAAKRLRHGRPKSERALQVAQSEQAQRNLDRHRIDTGDQS
jgi:Domain of unknown function (DUF4169)